MKLIKCTPEENGNFSLEFFFEPNDYFSNEVLKREFILDEDYDIKEIKSDEIDWKSDEMNPTIEIKQKKVKNKRTKKVKTITKKEKVPSFFSSFRHFEKKEGENKEKEEEDEDEEGDELTIEDEYDLALQFKEEIIPYAIEYYLGIAGDEDDLGEEDEEDEEEEDDDKHKYKGGKKGGFHGKKKPKYD